LEIKLDQIKGVGPQILRILRNKGIWTTYDLILTYPKSYEDFSITSLDQAIDRDVITVQAVISSDLKLQRFTKTERIIFEAKVFDDLVEVVVFGRGYLIDYKFLERKPNGSEYWLTVDLKDYTKFKIN
jgi:ATP-dependent DNA helicase RecG